MNRTYSSIPYGESSLNVAASSSLNYSSSYQPFYRKPSRFPYRKSYGYLVFLLLLLVMSWEAQKTDAAVVSASIPADAIRLRILANSDSAVDQAVKRHVRDAVVQAMNSWVTGPQTIEEARNTLRTHMPEIENIVREQLNSRGFSYNAHAELGVVPFPTKMYGSKVYPAGNYEALRITLGAGEGQNWWCVLFPPLCFIDAISGEASAASASSDEAAASAAPASSPAKTEVSKAEPAGSEGVAPEPKFFLWEMIQGLLNFIKSLF
ncbi:stage II sporulation protein R [Paenibacillus sp. GCM10023252]|uniref:stage II sporulation protein R n=1 Tax=Paenibacillus sp. GCM10023252 TaxID=3252649 RepID=UPI003621C505